MKSTHNITIQGKKGGSQSSTYTPVEQSDDLLSDAKLKMLVAVCEGETEGAVTAQQIYLNDTVLANEDGTYNFTGVNWEFRNGTQDQEYIQGMPEIDNELSVGVAVTTSSPWTHQFTDTSLDAIRIKLSLPAQYQYKDNGDMVGTVTEYAIDLSTDGGSYETVVSDKFDGKTTSEYQRDHRINLTRGGTTWAIRVRRITADSTSTKLVNAFKVYSYAEVVDSKLRYPNTALLYVEVDAGQFTSGAPKVTVKMKGKLIRVPDNYDPDTREYTGTWDGSFKMAYSNNPAWVFYDIILDKISGMGNRIDASMIDKWELYQIAEYCDEMVSDGAGGKEPRFTCNAYVQSQEDAFTVLQDFAAIFRGITFWGNSQIIVSADAPVDGPDWTYTVANVVDGLFSYAGGSYKNRYTSCLVSYSDPQNHYSDTTEAVYDADLLSRYGVQQMSLTAIGCTSQSEAHRRGRWALLSNAKDGTVSFSVGLDGHIPLPASIIGVADPYRAGKTNGGRISSVSGLNLTLDRAITFGAGDRLIVNLPDGTAQTRTIAGVSDDKKTVTVSTAFKTTPVAGAVWIIDSENLAIQQFRVTSITDNDDGTFTIAAVQYDPNKYSYIDDGVMVESAPVTVTPAKVMSAPGNITVNEVSHTSQGISLSSLQVAWDAVKGAVKYSAQWRRDSGEWINAGSVSSQGFTVNNIYAGIYEVRVRSVNSSGVSSPWGASDAVTLTGKQGKPPVPLSLTASDNTVFGIGLSWTFGDGSDDGLKTTLMVSTLSDHSDETLLADIPYPQSTYSLTGLASGVARYFRAAFTDKSGNQSDWTDYVTGQSSSNASDVLSYISGEISKTDLGKDLTTEIDAKADQSTVQQQISDASQQAQAAIDKATESSNSAISDANKAIEQANNAISTEIGDRIAAVQSEASARADALLNEENARKADINTVQTLIQNDSESLAQQIAQVAAGTGEQFDPYKIWYFDDKSVDGWSGNGDPTVTDDGWLKPADSDSEFATSPSGLGINGMAYQFIKARLKKVGSPEWVGEILWKDQSGDFSDQQSMVVTEPEYDENNIATLTVHDIPWQSMTVDQFKLSLTTSQTDTDYIIFDWIAVGRPTPGAGMAALQQEQMARVEADAAEATNRNTLAAQLRGPYTGTDAGQVTSGLIYSEQQLRISGDKAEATARKALETKLDNSVSEIDETMDTLNTATQANTSDISNLKSSLQATNNNVAQKADASALSALTTKVNSQADTITSQSKSINSLKNSLQSTNNAVSQKADSSALSALSNTVTSQGNTISSQGNSITSLQSVVSGQGDYIAKKADASALNNYYTKSQADSATAGQISKFGSSLVVGGRNLLANTASFNGAGSDGGTFNGNRVATFSKSKNDSGNYIDLSNPMTINPATGDTYTYSFYARSLNDGDTLDCFFYSPNTTTSATSSQGYVSSSSDGHTTFTLTKTMQRYYVTWTQSNTTTIKSVVMARINRDASKDQQVWISCPQLEIGNLPTDWSPAPEDVQSGTNANATAISNLSTSVKNQGDTITSQGNSINSLSNSLQSTNNAVAQKADSSALSTLSNTVSSQGNTLNSQGNNLTTLNNTITGILQQGAAINVNPLLNTADGWHMALGAVWSSTAGDGKPGVIMTKNGGSNPELYPNDGNWTMVSGARRYRFIVRGKSLGGAGNIIVRRHYKESASGADKTDDIQMIFPTGSFATRTADFPATSSGTVMVFFQSYCYPNAATVAIDSMAVYDVTDELTGTGNANAISGLTTTVNNQGGTISSQGTSITNLQNSVSQQQGRGSNLVTDGGFESFSATSGNLITDGAFHSGSRSAKAIRTAGTNAGGNNDITYGGWFNCRGSQIIYVELWARMDANSATQAGVSSVGIWSKDSSGGNSWNGAFNLQMSTIPTNNTWARYSGYCKLPDGAVQGTFWISIPQRSDNPQGTSFLIDDVFVCDATDGYNAQQSANAAASAVSTLQNTVTSQGNTISSHSTSITNLQNSLNTTNNNVNTKADASALNSLSTTVSNQGGTITAQGKSIDFLNTSVGNNTASIKSTQSTVSSLQGAVSATWSLKVQTDSNGNKTVAGIGLSSDSGNGSQFLVQADRFAMITGTNGNITSPFTVSGGQTYIQSAMIKDASITSAKITDIQSDNYSGENSGWKITKGGSAEFNDVTVRGEIYATEGSIDNVTIGQNCTIEGKLSANNIDGDVSKMFYLKKGSTITIPATSIDRIISIPTIYVFAAAFRNGQTGYVTNYSCNAQIKVNGSTVYTVSADSSTAYNLTALYFDLNVQSYSFSLAAGQSCTIGYGFYQPSSNLTRLMDYLMVVASKA